MKIIGLIFVFLLVLAEEYAGALVVENGEKQVQQVQQVQDDSGINWKALTPAEAETLIQKGDLDPNGFFMGTGKIKILLTPIMKVVEKNGNPEVLDILVKYGSDVNASVEKYKYTALHFAVHKGDIAMSRKLLQLKADMHSTKKPVIFNTLSNRRLKLDERKEMIDLLLMYGADINALDYSVQEEHSLVFTLLMSAIARAIREDREDDVNLISFIASRGGDVNFVPNGSEMTAMHLATNIVDINIMKELIELGGDVNLLNARGCWSPLSAFILFGQNIEVFDLLISEGADIEHKCTNGSNMIDLVRVRRDYEGGNSLDFVIDKEIFPTMSSWRDFGGTILLRIEGICKEERYKICNELERK